LNFSTIHSSYSRARLLLSDSVAIDGGPSEAAAAAAAAAAVEVDGFSTQPHHQLPSRRGDGERFLG
jgi:hypothetical protein